MSLIETVIEGTIQPDGTLVLDEKLNLPAGRATIVVRSAVTEARPLDAEFFRMMDDIWARQKARGFVPRSVEEVEGERQRMRDESAEEIEAAVRLHEEGRRLRGQETP